MLLHADHPLRRKIQRLQAALPTPAHREGARDLVARRTNLLELKRVLDEHGVAFTLEYGTLLGAVRDGALIAHDDDVDLRLRSDADQERFVKGALPALTARGFGIFGVYEWGVQLVRWSERTDLMFWYGAAEVREHLFLGERFLVPADAEEVLEATYGDWRVPADPSVPYWKWDGEAYYAWNGSEYVRSPYNETDAFRCEQAGLPALPERAPALVAKSAPPPPTVVIVVPCFAHAHLLPDAIESVLAQDRDDWQCVIVDDGSPDETPAVASALARRDPRGRIHCVRQAQAGLPAARNTGIRATQAPIVVPLDADDRLAPAYLSRVLGAFEADPELDLVFTDLAHFGELDDVAPYGPCDPHELLRQNVLPVTSAFRRTLWGRALGYDERMRDGYEDWDFWIACQEAGARMGHVPGALFLHRIAGPGALATAQRHDARLKASIVAKHRASFSSTQQRWAHRVLERAACGATSLVLEGQSFAAVSQLPNDGEAGADLGTMAYEAGDDDAAAACWAAALRSGDLTRAQRSALRSLAAGVGLAKAVRRRAR